mgnify:CR=1 FL=1
MIAQASHTKKSTPTNEHKNDKPEPPCENGNSGKDILEYLNWDIIKEECKNSSMGNLDITKDEEVVLNLIAIENASVDEIIQNTSLNFDDLYYCLYFYEQ